MSETIHNFLAQPKELPDTIKVRKTMELLRAVRLVDRELPIARIPLHIEPALRRQLEDEADQYDIAKNRFQEEVLESITHNRVIETLSVPKESLVGSVSVIQPIPVTLKPARVLVMDGPSRHVGHS